MHLFLLIALLCGLLLTSSSASDAEGRVFKHPLTDMPPSAEEVQTSAYLPGHTDLKLPVGEVVHALCHFTNAGPSVYNVTAVMGSLNALFDFRHHFQNYSYKPVGVAVGPGEEVSLKYSFQLHPEFEPVDYQLAVTVFYETETQSFSTTFFNQTVELYSPATEYDAESVFAVALSLAATAAVLVLAVFACFPETGLSLKVKKLLKKSFPQLVEQPGFVDVDENEEDDDWTETKKAKKSKRKNE